MSPTARASHGNVMQITTGTRWARTGNASASRRARAAEAAPGKAARVEPAARHDGFQDYYAVKSHLAAPRGGVREHVRSEVKSRGAMREGRACRGRTRAGGGPPGTSAPTTGPSHVPAPATFPPWFWRRSRAPRLGIGRKTRPLRGLGSVWRKPKALSAGAGNVFPLASLGVGREIGIGCPQKIGIRVLKTPPCAPRAFRL